MSILSHGNMFQLYIQPSSGLKEICPGTKYVYTSFVPGQISLRPDDGWMYNQNMLPWLNLLAPEFHI
jgi:hypothetical protein